MMWRYRKIKYYIIIIIIIIIIFLLHCSMRESA